MVAAPRLVPLLVVCALVLAGCGGAQGGGAEGRDSTASEPGRGDRCPEVQVVGVRGQSQSLDRHRGLGTEVDGIVTALERRLDRDGVDRVAVAAVRHRSRDAADLSTYDADVAQGRRLLARLLDREVGRCPGARVVVVGFSQGAQIAQETLADRPGLARGVDALALVGSPRHDPGSRFTHLDLPGPTAMLPGSVGAGPDLGALDARTVDACLARDVVCDADGGADYTVHKHGYEDVAVGGQVADAIDRVLVARSEHPDPGWP
jgi:pimeloyl-ACP methyl ester carboxylesterase